MVCLGIFHILVELVEFCRSRDEHGGKKLISIELRERMPRFLAEKLFLAFSKHLAKSL